MDIEISWESDTWNFETGREDNIKMDFKGIWSGKDDLTEMPGDSVQWRAFVLATMNLKVLISIQATMYPSRRWQVPDSSLGRDIY
jgi:hypothetical protein